MRFGPIIQALAVAVAEDHAVCRSDHSETKGNCMTDAVAIEEREAGSHCTVCISVNEQAACSLDGRDASGTASFNGDPNSLRTRASVRDGPGVDQGKANLEKRKAEIELAADRLLVLLAGAGGGFTAMTLEAAKDIVGILSAYNRDAISQRDKMDIGFAE